MRMRMTITRGQRKGRVNEQKRLESRKRMVRGGRKGEAGVEGLLIVDYDEEEEVERGENECLGDKMLAQPAFVWYGLVWLVWLVLI